MEATPGVRSSRRRAITTPGYCGVFGAHSGIEVEAGAVQEEAGADKRASVSGVGRRRRGVADPLEGDEVWAARTGNTSRRRAAPRLARASSPGRPGSRSRARRRAAGTAGKG